MTTTRSSLPAPTPKKRRHLLFKILFSLVFLLVLAELALRVQQKLGPWIDLEMAGIHPGIISDELNHRPEKLARWPYDDNGIIQYSDELLPPLIKSNPHAWKILFMGDSFVQGFGGNREIPWQVFSQFHSHSIPVIPYNAGYYSYSPSIFIVQAKKILPIVKPDRVVVVIDNTDLGDDAYRYKDLVVRDGQGKITAVRCNPNYAYFINEFLRIKEHPLFLMRAIHKFYHTRIGYPAKDQGVTFKISDRIMETIADQGPDVARKYAAETALFEANLRELADVLVTHVGSGKNVTWVCHPNPMHLETPNGKRSPNQLVFDAVEKVAREKGIHYYNAKDDLSRDFGTEPLKYYLQGDPVYHFTPEGCIIYARNIFEHLPDDWKEPRSPPPQ